MLKNMFTIAWRNAMRHKQFTLLNVLGLSLGVTATLLIGLYVIDEMSYDTFHPEGDRIYRVNQPMIWGDWDEQFASTGPNLGLALRTDIPEFEEVTRLHNDGGYVVSYLPDGEDAMTFNERRIFTAEPNFFSIFQFPMVTGNPESALESPFSVVITEEMATKYFGNEDPIGKTLQMRKGQNDNPFIVTAVVKDVPDNSHINFDMLVSWSSYQELKRREWQWIWTTFITYGKVKEGTDVAALEEKIQAIPPKWATPAVARVFDQSYEDYMGDKKWQLWLQPLREVYLYSPATGNRVGPSGNVAYVQIFGAVGVLILLLSSINFMNLSTARSSNRAKEVGIRKVLGSERHALVRQFIFESILFALVSTVIAMIITEFSLNAFNNIADRKLSLYTQLMNPVFGLSVLAFVLILGIIAGSYPAFYLSSFKPVEVLKGKLGSGFKGKGIRNALVVFQFTISVGLVISTFFVQKQLQYAADFDLGYSKENVLQIHNMQLLSDANQETFQTLMANDPAITHVGIADMVPPNVWNEDKYKAYGPDTDVITLNRIRMNEGYMQLLKPKLLAGRTFDETRGADKLKILLNAEAVKTLGWGTPESYAEDSPIGKHITFPSSSQALFEVIGVVDDFNFNNLRTEINPLLIIHEDNDLMWSSGAEFISMRINPASVKDGKDLQGLIDKVESTIKELDQGVPFEYSFMDERFEASFRNEQRMGRVLNIFTAIALSIACLGLFGLSAFSAEQRTKELGVRKVLGASVTDLVMLFSSEFTKLVLISLLVAAPLAYFFVDNWLSDFAYKTPISPWIFGLAGAGALLLSWATIGYQSMKAAFRNPVESLRDE